MKRRRCTAPHPCLPAPLGLRRAISTAAWSALPLLEHDDQAAVDLRAAALLGRALLIDFADPGDAPEHALRALDDLAVDRLDAQGAARACAPAVELLDALLVRVTWRRLQAAQDVVARELRDAAAPHDGQAGGDAETTPQSKDWRGS